MPTSDAPPWSRRRSSERAVSLLEIIVVCAIVLVLLGMSLSMIGSSRSTGGHLAARSTADAYASAAEEFARDHGGRYPDGPGSADWQGGGNAEKGPLALPLGSGNYYMRRVPEAVQDGRVKLGGSGPAVIEYQREGTGFKIEIRVKGRPTCALRGGGATGTSPKTCASRS